MIIGIPPSDNANVFLKVSTKSEEFDAPMQDRLQSDLKNIVKIYGLVSNTYVDVMAGGSASKISSEYPFGDKKLCGQFSLIPGFDDEQRRKQIPIIERTIAKYKAVKPIFNQKSKSFLENALDYYYRSLKDETLEEKIIDLMISLESLFSKEKDELGLRYSLRASYLLSVGQEAKRPDIFRNIHSLYNKRSEVVHGTENVMLEYKDITFLQENVREAIKRLIHIEMPKQKILELLDESAYDDEKRVVLSKIVAEAIRNW